jgi:ribosomal protein S18 acetylase RimI-like enzyme
LTSGTPHPIALRDYAEEDFETLAARWHETNLVSYPYNEEQQKHTLADARRFFRNHVLATCQVLVAERSGQLVGMLALQVPWIRHFAIFPEHQRQGVGTALLRCARELSGAELRLYTFQRNTPARAFYEKHGFDAVAFGVSPAPESEPDVEYRWTAFRSTNPAPE